MTTVWRKGNAEKRLQLLDYAVRRAMTVTGERLRQKAIREQSAARPGTIATGQTIRSQSVTPIMYDTDATGRFMYLRVGPRTPYAKWGIETGRGPGKMPPISAIKAWLREKPGGISLTDSELSRQAYHIALSISIRGTKPYFIMTKASKGEYKRFETVLKTSVLSILNRGV